MTEADVIIRHVLTSLDAHDSTPQHELALLEAQFAEHAERKRHLTSRPFPLPNQVPMGTGPSRAERERAADLSRAYNAFGMECLARTPEVASACLQRALVVAPHGDEVLALTLSNLGVCCMQRGKPALALRYHDP